MTTRRAITRSSTLDWSAAVKAGLAVGLAFAALQMILVTVADGIDIGTLLRMTAGILLGRWAAISPNAVGAGTVLAALLVHLSLTLLYDVVLGFIVRGLRVGAVVFAGGVFGAVLYAVNFFLFIGLFPWFADVRGWAAAVDHVLFGLALGGAYAVFAGRSVPRPSGKRRRVRP